MSGNVKTVALLLLLLVAFGVVGSMDYEDALQEEARLRAYYSGVCPPAVVVQHQLDTNVVKQMYARDCTHAGAGELHNVDNPPCPLARASR